MLNEVEAFMKRVDPEIYEHLKDNEAMSEVAADIKAEADELMQKIIDPSPLGGTGCNYEQIAYRLAMQNQGINKLIEEFEELRPSIRFIVSVLLGNEEEESEA